MDESAFRNLIGGQRRGVTAGVLRAALTVASGGYRAVIGFRNALYNAGLRKIVQVPVPVVSIGNITTGGTGKTPVVALTCQMLRECGATPGIISRGYRSVDGKANDEKKVLSLLCPDVPHEQNPNRVAGAESILKEHSLDALVMDDGFQHRRLYRNLDVVLIDATNPFGYGHLLPRGLLREPVASVRRASAILITRSDLVDETTLSTIERTLLQYAPRLHNNVFRVVFRPTGFVSPPGQRSELSASVVQPVFLVSGIGNPDAFALTCQRAGLRIAGTQWFQDHHAYTEGDLRAVVVEAKRLGASQIVTTLKDLVKLENAPDSFRALEIAADFSIDADRQRYLELIRDAVIRKAE
jgi:tetraacyldisaccharide 4'-kinase